MTKNKISIAQFNELMNIPPVVGDNDKGAKKELKFKLLDTLQEALADKWYNLKKATQEALQYACMRSTEQGFFFCSPAHIANKFKIGVSTLYNVFRELLEANVIHKVNRTSKKHNGKGNAVYVFVSHPNFSTICEILNIDWKANCNNNCKAESNEIPCGSKPESVNSAPTLLLPTTLQEKEKENVKHYNVSEDDTDKLLRKKIEEFERQQAEKPYEKPTVKWQKYVPKEINEKFGYFGSLLTDLWRKIKLAERKVNILRLRDIDKMEVAMRVLTNLKKHSRFKQMSLDEMCGYVYKGQLNGLFNLMGNDYLETSMFIDEDYEYYAYLDCNGNHIVTNTENEPFSDTVDEIVFEAPVRKLFNWLEEDITEEYYFEESYHVERPSLDNFPF